MFNFLKKKKRLSEDEAKGKRLEGVNALFAFLDEALPDHDPEGKGELEATAQIFLVFYIIGMAKAWCRFFELEEETNRSQKTIANIVIDGLYYRYDLEFRDWFLFASEFFDPDKYPEYAKHKFISEKIEQGMDHFFYFMTMSVIPHNPLDLLINEWSKISFYGEADEDGWSSNEYGGFGQRGEIEGVFTKEEYKFADLKMSYDLLEVDDDYERKNSLYLSLLDPLKKNPFKNEAYKKL